MAVNADSDIEPIWIESKLLSLGYDVWEEKVPRGANLQIPVILIRMQGPGRDISYNNNKRAITERVWQVAAVMATTYYGDVSELVANIDARLEGATGTNINGYDVISCSRQGVIRMHDDTDVPTVKLGGLYRIQCVKHPT